MIVPANIWLLMLRPATRSCLEIAVFSTPVMFLDLGTAPKALATDAMNKQASFWLYPSHLAADLLALTTCD